MPTLSVIKPNPFYKLLYTGKSNKKYLAKFTDEQLKLIKMFRNEISTNVERMKLDNNANLTRLHP
jgi:hypothetical protein